VQQQHRKTVRAKAPTTQPHQLLHQRERGKAPSTRDEHHLVLNKERRCKSITSQMERLNGRTRNLLGNKCPLGSKCPVSSRGRPRRKHPWGSVGGWNVPRGKPLDARPLPSKQPVLLTDGNEAPTPVRRRRTLQLRADRGSVSPRADLKVINS
jgi:hypothetical protein